MVFQQINNNDDDDDDDESSRKLSFFSSSSFSLVICMMMIIIIICRPMAFGHIAHHHHHIFRDCSRRNGIDLYRKKRKRTKVVSFPKNENIKENWPIFGFFFISRNAMEK